MEKTIEQKVADAILQRDVATLEICGKEYRIAPPSIATLIMVSEIVSTLPNVDKASGSDASSLVASVLSNARHCEALGDIVAVMILGAAECRPTEVWRIEERKMLFGLVKRRVRTKVVVDKRAELARLILDNVRPSVLWSIIIDRLNFLEVSDFFAITTSLAKANMLTPTREVEQ